MVNSIFDDDRGVTWTIEATFSVLLLLGILSATVISIPSQNADVAQEEVDELQMKQLGSDILSQSIQSEDSNMAAGDGFPAALLYWNPDKGKWWDSTVRNGRSEYLRVHTRPEHPLLESFSAVAASGYQYNIRVEGENGTRQSLSYLSAPGSNAVVISKSIYLDDGDALISANGGELTTQEVDCLDRNDSSVVTIEQVSDEPNCEFYLEDKYPSDSSSRYQTVTIYLTLWSS